MVQNKDLEKIKENYKIFIKKTLEYFVNKIKISGIISLILDITIKKKFIYIVMN